MKHVDILIPGPWWNPLTYLCEKDLAEGARVRVPVGKGNRTGLVLRNRTPSSMGNRPFRLRRIAETLDSFNFPGKELWLLSQWMSSRFLCSRGQILEIMLPSTFLKRGDMFNPGSCPDIPPAGNPPYLENIYDPVDELRWQKYAAFLEKARGKALVLFPEHSRARAFWESLPKDFRQKLPLWPSAPGKKRIGLWKKIRSGEIEGVIGPPAALFAPLQAPSLVVVDGEASGALNHQSAPYFNARTVAAMRARLWKAGLVLGGYMPSSRIYRKERPPCRSTPGDRLVLVDTRNTPAVAFAGIRRGLPVSQPLLRRSLNVLEKGQTVLWLLDRKGYAGQIICEECEHRLTCPFCRGPLRWDRGGDRLVCSLCHKGQAMPEKCPHCGSYLLEGNRPGLEALADVARGLLGKRYPFRIEPSPVRRRQTQSRPEDGDVKSGLVVGSRGALALCDTEHVGLVGWLEADTEAHNPFYDARFQAFSMIWESLWRGHAPQQREVLVQSRAPGKEWQMGLKAGWNHFWDHELRERHELDLPPYAALVRIRAEEDQLKILRQALEERDLDTLEPVEGGNELWVQSPRLSRIERALAPYMEISKPLGDFPLLRTWLD